MCFPWNFPHSLWLLLFVWCIHSFFQSNTSHIYIYCHCSSLLYICVVVSKIENHDNFFPDSWSGQPRWQSPVRQASATLDPGQCWFTDCIGKLLQGSASRPGHHPRGAASPETAGKHLAAPQSAAAPAPAALRLSAGRPTGTHIYIHIFKFMHTLFMILFICSASLLKYAVQDQT